MELLLQTRREAKWKKRLARMEADRFGFDSAAIYWWWSMYADEFPWCSQVISLSLWDKSKEAFIRSLHSHRVKNYWKGWTGATEVEAMNRAGRVSAEGKLPEWVQRWLSCRNRREGTQWCTCAAKIPTYPARMSSIYSEKWISLFFLCTLCSFYFASIVGKKTLKI